VAFSTVEGGSFVFERAEPSRVLCGEPGIGERSLAIGFDEIRGEIIVIGAFGLLRTYDCKTGGARLNQKIVLRNQEQGLKEAIVLADQRKVVTSEVAASEYGLIQIVDIDSFQQTLLVTEHEMAQLPMKASPDGSLIATASPDKAVRLWRTRDGLRASILRAHRAPVSGLCFFANGTRLASSDEEGKVYVWDISDARLSGKLLTEWMCKRIPVGVLILDQSDEDNLLLRDVFSRDRGSPPDFIRALKRFAE
jgi:hypothetical protein